MAAKDDEAKEGARLRSEDEDEIKEEKGRSLVFRMTEHAYMDEFFERHIDTFEQDSEDISTGRGETLEQYAAYQQFVVELEEHFESFAIKEGFSSSRDAFDFIQSAVSEDAVRQKEQMQKLQETIAAMQKRWDDSRQTVAEAKSTDTGLTLEDGPRAAWMEGAQPVAEAKSSTNRGAKDDDEDDDVKGIQSESKAESKQACLKSSQCELQVGSQVEVVNLESRPHLNGRSGLVVSVGANTFGVVLSNNQEGAGAGGGLFEEHKIKERNLQRTEGVVDKEGAEKAGINARKAKANEQAVAAEMAPIMMFCQPVPLESLIQSVLSIGEYTTFSMIMRMKVKERLMTRMMNQKIEEFEAECVTRLEQLSDLAVLGDGQVGREMLLLTLFKSLRSRITDLTARRPDLNEETEKELSDEVWVEMFQGEKGRSKQKLMEVIKFVFDQRLLLLSAPNDVEAIKEEARQVSDASWEQPLIETITMLLRLSHLRVDSIKRFSLKLFQAHAKAIASAKQAARKELEARADAK